VKKARKNWDFEAKTAFKHFYGKILVLALNCNFRYILYNRSIKLFTRRYPMRMFFKILFRLIEIIMFLLELFQNMP